jgi:hypothetical protein
MQIFSHAFKKREKVTYTSGHGVRFSARVETCHHDGSVTVRLLFPLEKDGREMRCGYMGDRYRVAPSAFLCAREGDDQ